MKEASLTIHWKEKQGFAVTQTGEPDLILCLGMAQVLKTFIEKNMNEAFDGKLGADRGDKGSPDQNS